jgi:hypothetical protein
VDRYAVKKGDTLARICAAIYHDSDLAVRLADYNAIKDPDLLLIHQVLEIPPLRDLTQKDGPVSVQPPLLLQPPHGLAEIIATFGDVRHFVRANGTLSWEWESNYLAEVELPFPIPVSWDLDEMVMRFVCHKKLAPIIEQVFQTIEAQGLRQSIKCFGGCFNFRAKRTGSKLSTHAWGISLDLNPLTNPQGRPGDMDPRVVAVFRKYGFSWGGDWAGRDKDFMHFQFCTGY